MTIDPSTMPASFRAGLDAALARPVLLDPAALAPLSASAAGLRPNAVARGSTDPADGPDVYTLDGDVAIVGIDGPLSQRAWSCWMFEGDGYDAIVQRAQTALDDPEARALVLRIDSPGGEVAGCFDAVRAIRAMATAAGKPVVAYADEMACSAAYALACAAEKIIVPDTGMVGSVGVILSLTSRAGQLAAQGVSVNLITSGAAKADGHPALALADDARARMQADIDHLARVFAAEVAKARPLDAAQVLALEARTLLGAEAVAAGLADTIGTLSTALTTARALADARDNARSTTMDIAKLNALLASARAAAGVEADDELVAAISTQRKRAERAEASERELTALRTQLAERDAADTAKARADVLAKHRQRGALTPAMEADAEYMGDLAPLAPASLDRVLSRLPSVPAAAQPRKVDAIDPAAAGAASTATDDDRTFARSAGVSEAALERAIADEKRRAASRT